MKLNDTLAPQLVMNEVVLPPGGEWSTRHTGWMALHVSAGIGFCLRPGSQCELKTDSVIVTSDQSQVTVRASQMGELRLAFFHIEPARLAGVVTLSDQKVLRDAARDERLALRVLAPDPDIIERFRKLAASEEQSSLLQRVELLHLFLELFGEKFEPARPPGAGVVDARERLKQTLKHTPMSDLISLGFAGLVSRTRCSPRHVSRLFTELVGVSFREKQTELRLGLACELLASTDSKVAEVAQECGFQSISLFGVMFKQRFGITPAKWRDQPGEPRLPVPRPNQRSLVRRSHSRSPV